MLGNWSCGNVAGGQPILKQQEGKTGTVDLETQRANLKNWELAPVLSSNDQNKRWSSQEPASPGVSAGPWYSRWRRAPALPAAQSAVSGYTASPQGPRTTPGMERIAEPFL